MTPADPIASPATCPLPVGDAGRRRRARVDRARAEGAGFAVHRVTFEEPGTDPIENLYARIGTAAPHLMLTGHTDVVPPGDEANWTHPPFASEIAGGVLYGRGAVDMKGAIACKIAAALDYLGGAWRQAEGLDLVPDHRRRGRHRGQRHREAAEMGGRARREIRSRHPGRADQSADSSAT